LQKVLIPVVKPAMQEQLEKVEDLVKAEVNVKEITYVTSDNGFIRKKIKPNYVALGKKLGPKMKQVATAFANFSQEDIQKIESEGSYTLSINDEQVVINKAEVEIQSEDVPGWMIATKDDLTVALDVNITPELENEGIARELVNRIQKIRKDNGYELTDRILVKVTENEKLNLSITQFNTYICAEILADSLELVPEMPDGTEIEVNDIPLKVYISKKG
jgi:isoleucyl-tRNA synthetase